MSTATPGAPAKAPRDFTYIKPMRRRLSEYEAVTCYTQPAPEHFGEGWFLLTKEGRPPWTPDSTELVHPDWFAFRDPAMQWQRTYVRMQAEQERSIERAVQDAICSDTFNRMDPVWFHEVVACHYRVWSYAEYGLFRAFAVAQREALSDTLGNVYTFEAFDRMRHAQDIVTYLLEAEGAVDDYHDDGCKRVWLEDAMYQPLRSLVERIIASNDWAEIGVVTNMVLDPILTDVAVSQLMGRFASYHGDPVVAFIVSSADRDRRRNLDWTKALVQMVTSDEVPEAAANRSTLERWIARWTPQVIEATEAMAPVYDVPPIQVVGFSEALESATRRQADLVASLGLKAGGR